MFSDYLNQDPNTTTYSHDADPFTMTFIDMAKRCAKDKSSSHGLVFETLPDPSFIKRELEHVEELSYFLLRHRSNLLRQLNFHESPICKLPQEILAHIFRHICVCLEEEGEEHGDKEREVLGRISRIPVHLGSICTHWRRVAWSTPQLWTCFVLHRHFFDKPQYPYFLDLYERSSGGLLTELHFYGSGRAHKSQNYLRERGITAMKDVLSRFSLRISRLRLNCMTLFQISMTFPNLRTLHIDEDDMPRTTRFELHPGIAPRLTDVSFRYEVIPFQMSIILPWTLITHLRWQGNEPKHCLQVLSQCPNIKYLSYSCISSGSILWSNLGLDSVVIMFNLEEIHLRLGNAYAREKWKLALFRHLRFPDLKKLSIITGSGDWVFGFMLQELNFFRDINTVQDLRIGVFEGDPQRMERILDILSLLPNLKNLHILFSTTPPDVFSLFTARNYSPAPSLCSLTLEINDNKWMDALAELLEAIKSQYRRDLKEETVATRELINTQSHSDNEMSEQPVMIRWNQSGGTSSAGWQSTTVEGCKRTSRKRQRLECLTFVSPLCLNLPSDIKSRAMETGRCVGLAISFKVRSGEEPPVSFS